MNKIASTIFTFLCFFIASLYLFPLLLAIINAIFIHSIFLLIAFLMAAIVIIGVFLGLGFWKRKLNSFILVALFLLYILISFFGFVVTVNSLLFR